MGVFQRTVRTRAVDTPADDLPGNLKRAKARPYGTVRTLQASAARLGPKDMAATAVTQAAYRDKQDQAWVHYDGIGEVHFGFNLVSNILSRVRLYAGNVTDPSAAPAPLSESTDEADVSDDLARQAEALLTELVETGFVGFMRAFALNMCVPGECLMLKLDGQWAIRSTAEVNVRADGAYLSPQRGQAMGQKLPKDTPIARIWHNHPKFSAEPDSSLMGVADPCEELLLVSRLIRSIVRSRLNAGLLFFPDGIVVAGKTVQPDVDPETGELIVAPVVDPGGSLLSDLMESMITPVTDEASASNVVPMVVTGPSDLGEKIRHLVFQRGSDEWLVNRADRALERVLQGIDVPKEIVTGIGQVKFSNALVVDEGLYKAHIEPLAIVLCDALTEIYLRPRLRAEGVSDSDLKRVAVWYDPSEIVTRPNQSEDASDGYDRGLVSGDSWRRAHGFGDDDVPTEEDLALLLTISKAQLPPEVTSALLQQVLPDILGKQREANVASSVVPFPDSAKKLLGQQQATGA